MANAPRPPRPPTRSLFDNLLARAEARPAPRAPPDPVAAGRAAFANMLISELVSVEARFELRHQPGRCLPKRAWKKKSVGPGAVPASCENELPVEKRRKVATGEGMVGVEHFGARYREDELSVEKCHNVATCEDLVVLDRGSVDDGASSGKDFHLEEGDERDCDVLSLNDCNALNAQLPSLLPPLSEDSIACSSDSYQPCSPIWACTAQTREAPEG